MTNKYLYLYIVQGYYDQGWEDLTCSESYKEAREALKVYKINEGGYFRLIQRRELKGAV